MAWGIPGNVGEIYRQQQSDELRDQLLKQEMAQRIRAFEAEQVYRQQQMAAQAEERAALERDRQSDREFRTGQMARQTRLDTRAEDKEAGQQRAVSNIQGLIPLVNQQTPEGRAEILGQALRIDPDRAVSELLKEPPVPKRYPVRTVGPGGRPIHKLATEEEYAAGIPDYQEPQQPRERDYEWVIRNGAPVQIEKGTAQAGDKPYDAVAARTPEGGAPSPTAIQHSQDVITQVDEILPRLGVTTTGMIGSVLANVPGTEARNVSRDLGSLGAKIAFDQLQKMREASKTGGALGNVSDRETELLTNVAASISQDQSETNLRKNMAIVKASAQRFLEAAAQQGNEPLRPRQNVTMTPGGMDASKLPDRRGATDAQDWLKVPPAQRPVGAKAKLPNVGPVTWDGSGWVK